MSGAAILACVKWVDLRPEVDVLTGTVRIDERTSGFSAADEAAVEVALSMADRAAGEQGATSAPRPTVVVASVGPAALERGLRDLLAVGVDRAVRVDVEADAPSEAVAMSLAAVARDVRADVVVCGDYSADRGSGAVPALVAHHLDAAQALGLVSVEARAGGGVTGVRRAGGGRSELLEVAAPAVISVEGTVARLRRAGLAATLAAERRVVEVVAAGDAARAARTGPRMSPPQPLRPRPRRLVAPAGADARSRIVTLTGAPADRSPPRTIEASPDEAAAAILDQLRVWGYLDP